MSQIGMQMPGGRSVRRKATPDVYTGLSFIAVAALFAAALLMGRAQMQVSPDGGLISLQQPGNVQLSN